MQTKEGKQPLSTVSSELAAMFSHVVLPTIQKHYFDDTDPQGKAKYQKACLEFARDKLKLPKGEQHRVTLPCFISMDWDTKHTWVRQFLAMPGRSFSARSAVAEKAMDLHLGVERSTQQPPQPEVEAASNLLDTLVPARRAAHVAKARRLQAHQDLSDSRRQAERDFQSHCGYSFTDIELCKKATMDSDFITLIPEQMMPLSKVSPDVHSPVEHVVGTIKAGVTKMVQEGSLVDNALRNGVTYQRLVDAVIADKLTGPQGEKHVHSSVTKQEIICKILSSDRGHKFTVNYTFGDPGPNKKTEHEVEGTQGDWIRATKWT